MHILRILTFLNNCYQKTVFSLIEEPITERGKPFEGGNCICLIGSYSLDTKIKISRKAGCYCCSMYVAT